MNTSDLIKELCKDKHISVAELARRMGQTPQNFNKKLKRGTVTYSEVLEIAEIMGVEFEQGFQYTDGRKLVLGSNSLKVSFLTREIQ